LDSIAQLLFERGEMPTWTRRLSLKEVSLGSPYVPTNV